jgi:3',5'-cyclic AMP phosphodiesterase CpdA
VKLYAISDLHLNAPENRQALKALPAHPQDWLIVVGDVDENPRRFRAAMALLATRFAKVVWTPGNHDLWTLSYDASAPRGLFKYNQLVTVCREVGVLTPEDRYARWPGSDEPVYIAPIFTLYDYTFRPEGVAVETAVRWAAESGIECADETLLHADPFTSRAAWCASRCRYTERRLAETAVHGQLILAGHFPLRQDLIELPRIPRFSIWCGTRRTEDWHLRYPVTAVVYGHLHMRASTNRDGVRFEEVSLGYPRHWDQSYGLAGYLRQILPVSELRYPI